MSSYYTCSKCKVRCISKCVNQRSVFIQSDETSCYGESILRMLASHSIVWKNDERATVTLEIDVVEPSTSLQADKDTLATVTAISLLRDTALSDDAIRRFACRHDWQIEETECMFGCCHKDD